MFAPLSRVKIFADWPVNYDRITVYSNRAPEASRYRGGPPPNTLRRERMKITYTAVLALFSLMLAASGCATKPEATETAAEIDPAKLQMYAPLPEQVVSDANPMTEAKITLGRMLFYEPRLSKSQEISCNSCHQLDNYGVDGETTSDGHKGQKGNRNSPTVYNAAGHFVQFWDGRAADVEEQAKGPILNPVEMAMASEKQTVEVLKSMPEYVQAFQAAFPGERDPITYENVAKAIGAFERRLVTYSPWDRYLRGDQNALTAEGRRPTPSGGNE